LPECKGETSALAIILSINFMRLKLEAGLAEGEEPILLNFAKYQGKYFADLLREGKR